MQAPCRLVRWCWGLAQATLLPWPRLKYLLAKRKAITRSTREWGEAEGGGLRRAAAKERACELESARHARTHWNSVFFFGFLFFNSFLFFLFSEVAIKKHQTSWPLAPALHPSRSSPFFGCYSILFSIPRSFFAPFLLLLLYILICCQLLSARLHGVVGTSRVICSNTVCPFTTNSREYRDPRALASKHNRVERSVDTLEIFGI